MPAPARLTGRRGFAIIISITLLAFLVLLLLSLVMLTRVGTQISANGLQDALARQNALTALNIALGQLERYAGPDQRVTGVADLGRSNDGNADTALPAGFTARTDGAATGLAAPATSGGTRQ